MQRKKTKSAPVHQSTLQALTARVASLEHEVALLSLTGQLRQALRRIAVLEAK